MSKLKSALSRP